jgi:signal transduction histidine kinase
VDKLVILKKIDFFKSLKNRDLEKISSFFHEALYRKDEVIFKEGEPGDSFYILKDGRVGITIRLNEDTNAEAELRVFEPHEYFGEMSLIDNSPRSATARAITDSVLFRIMKDDFIKVSLNYPGIITSLIRTMSDRIRATNEQFAHVLESLINKSKMAAIGSAASKIVHDIKTPITSIVLTAQQLEELFPNTKKFTGRIVKQTKILNEMVREILDFASGAMSSLEIVENELGSFFKNILESLEPLAAEKGIKIQLDNPVDSHIYFDALKIERTIINIVKNAVEAMERPGVITIRCKEKNGNLHIAIFDNGPGIPEDILQTVFDPFVSKGKTVGTGLGLSMCQKVVHDHKGSITACNLKKGGARFDIILPKRSESETRDRVGESNKKPRDKMGNL